MSAIVKPGGSSNIEMSVQAHSISPTHAETKQQPTSVTATTTTTTTTVPTATPTIFEPPTLKQLGKPVISIRELSKSYVLPGREEPVRALSEINLCDDPKLTEFYSIRTGEFIMIRGPI